MSKLTITGYAKREVQYDALDMTVRFYVREKSTEEALSKVMDQCEAFLVLVTEAGVSMKDIHIGENNTDQNYSDDKLYVKASRELKIRLKFDMAFVNALMEMIREKGFAADIDCDYMITDKQQIHNALMKEALADSKAKAESIAEAMGQKITGIDTVKLGHAGGLDEWPCEQECEYLMACGARPLSNQIESPVTTESESIDVVWIME